MTAQGDIYEHIPPCSETDFLNTHGVLLSNEIKFYVNKFKLIDPFEEKNLDPAAYKLTIGTEYKIGGQKKKLYSEPGKDEIELKPFQVVIIQTREILNMPRYFIGRWNLRVSRVYEGLLWVGGAQVDPGYYGPLYCPIYNLSNSNVILRLGEPIAVIDFVKTTPFIENECKKFPRPPRRREIDDYPGLVSALYTILTDKIEGIEDLIKTFTARFDKYFSIIFTIFALIIAALSVIVTSNFETSTNLWGLFSVIFTASSLGIFIFLYYKYKYQIQKEKIVNFTDEKKG
jgi:deoxycytidine triphosphate deaminase